MTLLFLENIMPISQYCLLPSVNKLQRELKHPNSVVPFIGTNSATTIADAHEIAYWYQWRIAIHEVCIRFEATTQIEAEGWSRERLDQIAISTQASLRAEVQHLESQLGKFASLNAKLEAALSEKVNDLAKSEMAREAAITATCKLQTQITRDKETVAAAVRGLEERLSRSNSVRTNLEARVHEAESAKLTAEQRATEISQNVSKLGVELSQVREESIRLKAESRSNRTKMESINADLETLRDKYTTLKRRYADAGRKVENIRAERDTLRSELATLEDKLSDVEKFRESERGQTFEKMEQELAAEKMARVELEADRDDLQSQLAAALGSSRRAIARTEASNKDIPKLPL